ncbi:MAG: extracellular solute-binding protein [Nitrososphaeria archaeon]
MAFLSWVLSEKGYEKGFQYLVALEENVKVHPSGWTSSIQVLKTGEVYAGIMFNTDMGYSETPNLTSTVEEGFIYREGIALVKNRKHIESAKLFVEYVLSKEGQDLIPDNNYMFPVNSNAAVPSWLESAPKPKKAVIFDSSISGSIVEWSEKWRREILGGS